MGEKVINAPANMIIYSTNNKMLFILMFKFYIKRLLVDDIYGLQVPLHRNSYCEVSYALWFYVGVS